jgi:membrane-anchored mycosin MYCP
MRMPRTSPIRRVAVSVLAAAIVMAVSVLRPAAAYALGSELRPEWCYPTTQAGQVTGKLTDAWHISRLKPDQVWAQNDAKGRPITGTGITIAVIDTAAQIGISPFLRASPTTPGVKPTWKLVDYVGSDKAEIGRNVDSGGYGLNCAHGTRVVSLINAQALDEDDSNFSGMAPGSSVIVMRALKSDTDVEDQAPLAAAINDAVATPGVDIINISQAGSDDTAVRDAVANAVAHGIVVVASSGNAGDLGPRYPASYPGVISVGMTTTSDAPHPSSEEGVGVNVTVAAPGDAIVALLASAPDGRTMSTETFLKTSQVWNTEPGTSFAAPIVTGVVALMLQKAKAEGASLTPAEVTRRLELTADPPPGAVPDAQLGYGVVDPARAVFGPFPQSATVSATPTSTPSAGPLEIPAGRDTVPMMVAVGVTLGVLTLLAGAVLVREALSPMRRRKYAPARSDES